MKRLLSESSPFFDLIELFDKDVSPLDVTLFSSVNLQAKEAHGGGVFFVVVDEVGAEFTVDPDLEVLTLGLDRDGVPIEARFF